jgi:hypothetical protein
MPDRLVTVATFHQPVAATLAKNFLESEGIPAVLFDESTVATDWMLSTAIGGIKLQVAPEHLERAEFLLGRIQEERDQDEMPPAPQTAIATQEIAEEMQSEREDKKPINQLADRLFRSAVFGLILCPVQAYVLILLLQLRWEEGKVSPNRRWKVWASMLLNVPLMSLVVVPLLYLTHSFSSDPPGPENPVWRPYDYRDQGFSVNFPHEPWVNTAHVPTDYGESRYYRLYGWAHQRGYQVEVWQCPPGVRDFPVEKLLQDELQNKTDYADKKILRDDPIHLDDVPGREFLIDVGKAHLRGQLFLHGQDFYLLTAYGSKGNVLSGEADKFFKSLQWR